MPAYFCLNYLFHYAIASVYRVLVDYLDLSSWHQENSIEDWEYDTLRYS